MKSLTIGKFRELAQNCDKAKQLLSTHPRLAENCWAGRILRGLADGLTAKQACLKSFDWEKKEFGDKFPGFSNDFNDFYTPKQIVSTTRTALRLFTRLFMKSNQQNNPNQ